MFLGFYFSFFLILKIFLIFIYISFIKKSRKSKWYLQNLGCQSFIYMLQFKSLDKDMMSAEK